MATIENNVLIRAKDTSDNDQLFYPVTKLENVNGLQSALDGKAASSHGTHVSYSTTDPLVAGTASAGSAETVARSDHVHPAQIDVSGNAETASKWKTAININGMTVQGDANRTNYGISSTEARDTYKIVDCPGFELVPGAEITVKFTVTNTAINPGLNVNNTDAKPMRYRGAPIPSGCLTANSTYTFRYDGAYYNLVGDLDGTDSGFCYTSASKAEKTVGCEGFALTTGAKITVKFTKGNTAENPTLNVNKTGAKPMYYRGSPIPGAYLAENSTHTFRYDGTNYDLVGEISANHGTHVTFSTSDPLVAGTASAGSAETVARSDHVHPAQIDVSGNAETASKWKTAININGMTVQGDANRTNYGISSTEARDTYKIVDCPGFELVPGAEITVKFTVTNTAINPGLNVNNTDAKPMRYRGAPIPSGCLTANSTYTFRYDGAYYNLVGDLDGTDSGFCYTSASKAEKTVGCEGFALTTGAKITVKFTKGNTAENPTLNVNKTGAKPMYYRGAPIPSNGLAANGTYTFSFDGTNYDIVGDIITNNT